MIIPKTVNLDLVGIDGNAFSVLGHFEKQARKEGWSKEEIKKMRTEATKRDYDHLLATIVEHINMEETSGQT